jgi:hypothetical protein
MGFQSTMLLTQAGTLNKAKLENLILRGQKISVPVANNNFEPLDKPVTLQGVYNHKITTLPEDISLTHEFDSQIEFKGRTFTASVRISSTQELKGIIAVIQFEIYPENNVSE